MAAAWPRWPGATKYLSSIPFHPTGRWRSLGAVVPYEKMGWRAEALPASVSYSVKGQLQYNAPNRLAQILFDTGVRRPKVSFGSRGELHLR